MGKCGCCGCKQCNRKIEKIIITATQGGESMIHEEIIGGKSIKDILNNSLPSLTPFFSINVKNTNNNIFYEHNLNFIQRRYKRPIQINSCGQYYLGGCDPCYLYKTPWQIIDKKLLFKQILKKHLEDINLSLWPECDINYIRAEISYTTKNTAYMPETYFTIITDESYNDYLNKNCVFGVTWKAKETFSERIGVNSNNSGIGQKNGLSHAFTCCNNSLLEKHIIPKSRNACIMYGVGDSIFGNGITREYVSCSDPDNPDMSIIENHFIETPNFLNIAWWETGNENFEFLGYIDADGGAFTGHCSSPPDISEFRTNVNTYIEPVIDTDIIINIDIVYSEEQNYLCYNKFEYSSKIHDLKTAVINCGSNNSHKAVLDLSNSSRRNTFDSRILYDKNFNINGESFNNIASGSGNFDPFGYFNYSKRYDNWNSSKFSDALCFSGRYEGSISHYSYIGSQICFDQFNRPVFCQGCSSPEGVAPYPVIPVHLCKTSEFRNSSYFNFYLSGEITIKIINSKIHLLINIYQKSTPFHVYINKDLPDVKFYCSETIFGNTGLPPGLDSLGPYFDKEISSINPFLYLYKKEVILDDVEQLFSSHRADIVGSHPNILQLQDHITVNLYENNYSF